MVVIDDVRPVLLVEGETDGAIEVALDERVRFPALGRSRERDEPLAQVLQQIGDGGRAAAVQSEHRLGAGADLRGAPAFDDGSGEGRDVDDTVSVTGVAGGRGRCIGRSSAVAVTGRAGGGHDRHEDEQRYQEQKRASHVAFPPQVLFRRGSSAHGSSLRPASPRERDACYGERDGAHRARGAGGLRYHP